LIGISGGGSSRRPRSIKVCRARERRRYMHDTIKRSIISCSASRRRTQAIRAQESLHNLIIHSFVFL
jgi:hypothetical protein